MNNVRVKLTGMPSSRSFNVETFVIGNYSPSNLRWLRENDGKIFEVSNIEGNYYSILLPSGEVMKVHRMECEIYDDDSQDRVETEYDLL